MTVQIARLLIKNIILRMLASDDDVVCGMALQWEHKSYHQKKDAVSFVQFACIGYRNDERELVKSALDIIVDEDAKMKYLVSKCLEHSPNATLQEIDKFCFDEYEYVRPWDYEVV